MELLQIKTFKEALFQSRNAKEALLAALNACARVTVRVSEITYPDSTTFGTWFKRIQGQRAESDLVLAVDCLSYLKLNNAILQENDFYHANYYSSDLAGANLRDTNLEGTELSRGMLTVNKNNEN